MKVHILLLAALTISCNMSERNSKNLYLEEIVIDPSKNPKEKISGVLKINSVIPIKTQNDDYFGQIRGGYSLDSIYIFYDSELDGNIIETNTFGEVIKIINHRGDDPFQYRKLTNLEINYSPFMYEVYDFDKQTKLYYDYKGKFISRQKVAYYYLNSIEYFGYQIIFTAKHENVIDGNVIYNDVIVLDSSFNYLSSYLPFSGENYSNVRYHTSTPFFVRNNKVLYSDLLNDTIYEVGVKRIVPKYIFKYENEKLPKRFYLNSHEPLINAFLSDPNQLANYDFSADMIFVDDSYLFYSYISNMSSFLGIYSFNDKKSINVQLDHSFDWLRIFKPIFSENNQYISVVPVNVLTTYKEILNEGELYDNLDILANLEPETSVIVKFSVIPQ